MKKEYLLFLTAFIIAAFFFFYEIWQYPRDLYFEPTMYGSAGILTSEAIKTGTPIMEAINKFELWKTPATTSYLYQDILSLPFNNVLMAFFIAVFSSPLLAYLIVGAVGGFLASILSFFVGKKFYDLQTGFITSVLISTSFYFLIHSRGVTVPLYGFLAFIAALVIFTFYIAHVKKTWVSLILASLAGSLAWFFGYTQIYVLPAILLLFLIWSLNWRSVFKFPKGPTPNGLVVYLKNFWGKTLLAPYKYFLAVLVMFMVFLFLTVAYSIVLKTPSKLDTYRAIPEYNLTRLSGMQQSLTAQKNKIQKNTSEFIINAFISGGMGSSPGPQNPPGKPIMYPLVTFFFLIGIIIAFKKRTLADKLVLLWFFVSLFFMIFVFEFQTRYLMLPAISLYLLSARGFGGILNFLALHLSGAASNFKILLTTALIVLLVFYAYTNFFQDYTYRGSNNKENFGYYDLTQYLLKNTDPKTTALIFEDNAYVAPAHIYFHTKGLTYDFIFWKNLQREGPIDWSFNENLLGGEITTWEKKTLAEKEKILYLHIKNPYFGSDIQLFKNQFLKFHPDQKAPIEVIRDINGNPAFEIYRIKKYEIY